ncbi:hypothetical protein [Roseibium sp.]|uniref:hypothetical protein n=1 Tax=Roseibium sp. TaxID=1936156 RepID=UPI003BACE547
MPSQQLLQVIGYLGMTGQQRGDLAAVVNVCAWQEIACEFEKNPFFFNVMLLPTDKYLGRRKQDIPVSRARRTVVTGRLRLRLLKFFALALSHNTRLQIRKTVRPSEAVSFKLHQKR